jgi:hypothetical protein
MKMANVAASLAMLGHTSGLFAGLSVMISLISVARGHHTSYPEIDKGENSGRAGSFTPAR